MEGRPDVPDAAREILRHGTLCYLAAPSPEGPHLTPVVFVLEGDRVWLTTSRRAVKTRLWRRRPHAGGLVSVEHRAVVFRGPVTLYDALDPSTWPASVVRGPAVARASLRFTLKNARFFAGYARDAYRVPLAWTPPGRVVASVDLEGGAVLDVAAGRVIERWGMGPARVAGRGGFRTAGEAPDLKAAVPPEVGDVLVPAGRGVLGLEGEGGPAVAPVRWARSVDGYYAVLSRSVLDMAGPPARGRGSLVVDRASAWRAARMVGALLRGAADVYLLGDLRSGRKALDAHSAPAGPRPERPVVVRLRPETAVWWKGWSSGTVGRR